MSDSEHSTVTYTSVSEDDLYMGSPGVEVPIFEVPPSPTTLPALKDPINRLRCPGLEEPEQAPLHLSMYICSGAVYPGSLTMMKRRILREVSSLTILLRGDDDDDAEDEHLAPAEPAAVAYSADQDPYIAYRLLFERVLALPTPPPSPLSPYSSPLPQIPSPPLPIPPPPPIIPTYAEGSLGSRAAGIRQRDALPSHVHETEMPEMCLPLRKRPCRTTPGPGYEVGESSAAGTARQDALGRRMSRELGYGIRDTWDDLVRRPSRVDCHGNTIERVQPGVIELYSHYAQRSDEEDGQFIVPLGTVDGCLRFSAFRGHNTWTYGLSETEIVSGGTKSEEASETLNDRAAVHSRVLLRICQSQIYQRRPVAVLRLGL
ncbi:hypothetical protein Tco_0184929 [Tanacetum coccineum]